MAKSILAGLEGPLGSIGWALALLSVVGCVGSMGKNVDAGWANGSGAGSGGTGGIGDGSSPVGSETGARPQADGGDAPSDGVADTPGRGERLDAAVTPDMGTSPPAGRVPMFIGQGDMGRITISCDDGRTWKINHSWDTDGDPMVCGRQQPMRCGGECWWLQGRDGSCVHSTSCDCGHHPGFGKGVAFGNDTVVATWGWGHPGSIRRSRNGIDWEETAGIKGIAKDSFGGLDFGAGHFVLANPNSFFSIDGKTWTQGGPADFRLNGQMLWSVRRFAYVDHDGGRFIAVSDGIMLLSSDHARSWWRPSMIPAVCFGSVAPAGGIAYGGGVILLVRSDGGACRSLDGGRTWSGTQTGSNLINSQVIWTGTEFMVWGNWDSVFRSADGLRWTRTLTVPKVNIGAVARSDKGTFVATNSFWDPYEKQAFLRSQDGVTWEVLPRNAFTGSHAIYSIDFGQAEASSVCRLPTP